MIKFLEELIPTTENQITDKANRLTTKAIAILAVYGIILSILDYSMGFNYTALINLGLFFLSICALYLLSLGKIVAAKLLIITGTGVIITALYLMFKADTAILSYFIPFLLSLQVVFKGKEKRFSKYLLVLGIITFVVLLFTSYRMSFAYSLDMQGVKYQIAMNLIGAMYFSLIIANFIHKINESISHQLITQGKELMNKNKLLKATLETRDKLMEVVSHDLRSPFLAIEASLEILNDPHTDEFERQMVLKSLNRKSESTMALLNNLLFWSQSQTDTIKYEPEPIYLDEIEPTVNGVLRMLAEEKKLKLNIEFEPGIAVFADKNMLNSIIRNLISNAVKFSNNGSSIDLIAKFDNGFVTFTVQDYGLGMSEYVVKKLRQKTPFTLDGTLKETGHGIGLVLVHQFISAHESVLNVSSEIGAGTMFQFKLKAVSG